MQGIIKTHAPEQTVRQVQPAVTSIIYKLVDPLGTSLIDQRDRALILLGFSGAFRRSELAQLRVADIIETEDGLRVRLRRSKTDQEGEGFVKGILPMVMNKKRVQFVPGKYGKKRRTSWTTRRSDLLTNTRR